MPAFHYHTTESVTECIIQCRVGVAVPSIPLGELFDCYWLEKIEENIAWKAMIEIYRAAYRHTANKRLIAAMPNKSFDLFDLHWKAGGDTVADSMTVPKSKGRGSDGNRKGNCTQRLLLYRLEVSAVSSWPTK